MKVPTSHKKSLVKWCLITWAIKTNCLKVTSAENVSLICYRGINGEHQKNITALSHADTKFVYHMVDIDVCQLTTTLYRMKS